MTVAGRHWLFKSEPSAYSYDDLVRDSVAEWDGVRNFQARNFLRDEIKAGDRLLFYHSSTKPMAVIGTASVVREGYPDSTAWDPKSAHPDPKSPPESPIWYMVDIKAEQRLSRQVTLDEMKSNPRLAAMLLLKRGVRLSIQPVTAEEFDAVVEMGSRGAID